MIEFKCEQCETDYKVKYEYAGKQMRCKKCGHVNTIPEVHVEGEMPDFDALFSALAEEELHAPTLEDSMLGV